MVKKGDTLIEVTLAIGIFSLVAISIAAVLNGSTSGAQTALETTLTREEIDTQADALRYIQTAYAVNRNDTTNNKYQDLWDAIDKASLTITNEWNEDRKNGVLQYAPTSCNDLYSNSDIASHAFIINPRALGGLSPTSKNPTNVDNVLIKHSTGSANKLTTATIYPRLIYGTSTNNDSQIAITNSLNSTQLYRAEGLYVLAVKDANTTVSVGTDDPQMSSSFYDFYIRSCWYGIDADQPSTISTVIRLYNPDSVTAAAVGLVSVAYKSNFSGIANPGSVTKTKVTLPTLEKYGYTFKGWCTKNTTGNANDANGQGCLGEIFAGGRVLTNPETIIATYNFTGVWEHTKYTVKYNPNYPYNDSSTTVNSQTCYLDTGCTLESTAPTASGYKFGGWCTVKVDINGTCPSGKLYNPGATIQSANFDSLFTGASRTLNLYATWKEHNEVLKVYLTWGSGYSDLDSYVTGQKSNGTSFTAYYGNKIGSDVSGLVIAQLDHDCTGSCKNETFDINTLGGKTYYYYVRNYSSNSSISGSGVTVNVSIKQPNGTYQTVATYKSSDATGSGRVWNVFAYKNGAIVKRQTRSDSAETSY